MYNYQNYFSRSKQKADFVALGGLYMREQYGLIVAAEQRKTRGDVLIEHEPVSFEMSNFEQGELRHQVRREIVLKHKDLVIQGGKDEEGTQNHCITKS